MIQTDCNSLKMLENWRDLKPRIGRWFMRLANFNYAIMYRRGECNRVAVILSGPPVDQERETEIIGLSVLGVHLATDWIAAVQRGTQIS